MSKKDISGKSLSRTITSEDILGKKVLDSEGDFIGVVEKVLLDPNTFDSIGISIDKGFLRKGLTIGKSYIKKVTSHVVFLKIPVPYKYKNMIVFDSEGKVIGKVASIDLIGGKNQIKCLNVARDVFSKIVRRVIRVPARDIKSTGENIILKVTKERLIGIEGQ